MKRTAVLAALVGLILAAVFATDSKSRDALAGEKEKAKARAKTQPLVLVINYPYQITGSATTKIHTTLLKPDFTPAAGAVVKVNGKQVGTADENGTCIFDYQPGANRSHQLVATYKEKGRHYRVDKSFSSNARTASFRSDQLFVYTDRAVYNPGDNVLIRMLAWELLGGYTAIDKAQVSLMLQNGAGRTFTGMKLTTNEFGVAASRIPLAENMPEGDYELVVLYNKARETARLRVERFVPPVMNIDHDLKRFMTPAQNELAVQVEVSYFAGGKPSSSTLKLAVLNQQGETVFSKPFETTSPARFQFTLSEAQLDSIRKKLTPELPFKTVLEVTDGFGRTSKVTRDMVYTRRPYRAVLEFDKDDYPTGEEVKLQAKVTDLDGKPARGIQLTCTVAEFKVKENAVTDDSGVAVFSFKMGKTAGTAVVTSPIMPDPLASKAVRLNQPKPMTSKVHEPPDKQGSKVKFHVTFHKDYAPVEKVVHVDFTDLSGGLAQSATIPVFHTSEKGYWAEGTVTADTWGTMLANLYVCAATSEDVKKGRKLSVKNVGFITEGQHVTLYPDAEAEIVITGLKPRVRPGEKLTFDVQVKTKTGSEAALGAAMVDQAVLSLMDPLEVTPKDHFYNPQRKVISTGGAGVLTWPVVDRNWGSPWRDIAYTNWGFKGPGGWVGGSGRSQGGEGAGGSAGLDKKSGELNMISAPKGAKSKVKLMMAKPVATMMAEEKADPSPEAEPMDAMEMDGDHESADTGVQPAARARRRDAKARARTPVQITIRTRFPETALWMPLLETKNGKTSIAVEFPDAITVQQVILMASDKNGNLGLVRHNVEVRQDFFIQSGLPATMTVGDTLQVGALVQNMSGSKAAVMASLSADNLSILGPAVVPVEVENEASAPVAWTVTAGKAGWATFEIAAGSERFRDTEKRRIFVRPAGEPDLGLERGELSSGTPFEATLQLDHANSYQAVFLNVSFPDVIPGLQAWEAVQEAPLGYIGVVGVASRALMDVALLQWGLKNRRPEPWVTNMKQRLQRAAAELAGAQDTDGGWGWHYLADAGNSRGGYSKSVYITAFVLRALAEVRMADFPVQDAVMQKGVEFLMKARNKDGLWSAAGAYFWEVNAPETDWGLSADLFSIVAQSASTLSGKPSAALSKLKKTMLKKLDSRPDDAATTAFIIRGLGQWATWQKDRKLATAVENALPHLLELKRSGYWEPHWYHAYGGNVELNAEILALLEKLKPDHYESAKREIITWLLSTREAWGAWHNEAGTVHAVRALLRAGAGQIQEKASTVQVRVNGRVVRKVAVDPADPFLSAARLRYLELTGYMKSGANQVTVSYDGNLTIPVLLETRQWKQGTSTAMQHAGPGLTVKRTAPASAGMGEPVKAAIEVTADRLARMVRVVDRIPSNLRVEAKSLEALVRSGALLTFEITEDSVVMLVPEIKRSVNLEYQLLASRPGVATHPGTTASIMNDKRIRAGHFVGKAIEITN